MSTHVTVAVDGTTATCRPATITDIITTSFSTDQAVTGMYGFIQKAGLVVVGMTINAKRYRNSLNPFAK